MLRDDIGKRSKTHSIYEVISQKGISVHRFSKGVFRVLGEWEMVVIGRNRSIVKALAEEGIVADSIILFWLCLDFLSSWRSDNINWVFYLLPTAAFSRWDILVTIVVFVEFSSKIKDMSVEVWVPDIHSVGWGLDVLNLNKNTSKYSS